MDPKRKKLLKWVIGAVMVPSIPMGIFLWERICLEEAPKMDPMPIYRQLERFNKNIERLIVIYDEHQRGLPGSGIPELKHRTTETLEKAGTQTLADAYIGKIELANSSEYQGRRKYVVGKNVWQWTAYIVTEKAIFDKINYVEYHLHPTFSPNKIRIEDKGTPGSGFPLSRSGWGTFTIRASVYFSDKSMLELEHYLVFQDRKGAALK